MNPACIEVKFEPPENPLRVIVIATSIVDAPGPKELLSNINSIGEDTPNVLFIAGGLQALNNSPSKHSSITPRMPDVS